ncbi:hypothetical protein B0H11DRAFT_1647285, partial [Mycena galericulata]
QIRRLAFAVIHSSTLLLPMWRRLCVGEGLKARVIPRDVATRWNSTFDMLKVAIEYRTIVDLMVSDKKTGLRKFELDDLEWLALKDLLRVLKV